MISLGKETVKRTRASWHRDQDINRRQGELLARDVLATRTKLIRELLIARFGPGTEKRPDLHRRLKLVPQGNGVVWVVWHASDADRQGQAIALFTFPKTRIQGYHMICEWHWHVLPDDQGVARLGEAQTLPRANG